MTCQVPSCGAAHAGYGWLALARHKTNGNMFRTLALGHVSVVGIQWAAQLAGSGGNNFHMHATPT